MFHSRNGLFFQATGQGNVAIIATNDGKEPFTRSHANSDKVDTNIVCNVTLPENEWASVVCSVSKDGETASRWNQARRFHGTEIPIPEAPPETLSPQDEEWMNAPMGTPKPADLNSAEALLAAIDDMLTKCGYVIHDERRISLEMMRDRVLTDREAVMSGINLWTEIHNLRNERAAKHAERCRADFAAHQARLKAVGMGI